MAIREVALLCWEDQILVQIAQDAQLLRRTLGELERLSGGGHSQVEGPRHKSFYESLLLPHKVAFPRDLDLFKKKRNK